MSKVEDAAYRAAREIERDLANISAFCDHGHPSPRRVFVGLNAREVDAIQQRIEDAIREAQS